MLRVVLCVMLCVGVHVVSVVSVVCVVVAVAVVVVYGVCRRDLWLWLWSWCVSVCRVVWHAENPRVWIQNVPVCAGTTRTC